MKPMTLLLLLAIAGAGCAAPFEGAMPYRPASVRDSTEDGFARPSVTGPEAASEGETPPHPLTLADCVALALERRRTVRIADRRVLIAQDRLLEAKATVFPKITLEERYSARVNDPGGSFGGSGTVTGRREVSFTKLSLLVPIYDFGVSSNTRDALRRNIEAEGFRSVRAREALTFDVTLAYYRVLEAQQIREIVADSIGVIEEQRRIAQDFLAQGLVARNDVLTADVQLSQRRQDLIRAEGNVALAVATLNRQMGLDVDAATELSGEGEADLWNGSYYGVLRRAIDARADLHALRSQIAAAQAEYKAVSAGRAPRLYAFGDFNYSTDDFLLHQQWMSGGVVLEFPLFDGGVTLARLKRKHKEIAESIDVHDETVDDIVLDVKAAWLAVRDAAGRMPVAREEIRLAEENLRIVRDQYREGLLTSADVLFEENRLSVSKSGYQTARYDYHEAYARMVHAIGGDPADAR